MHAGEVFGRFVPQSVTTKDGQALDVNIVVNEILSDGDELYVEYSNGPQAYRVRWEDRPRSPPFKWGGEGEIIPPHDLWLMELDLMKEGVLSLVDVDAHGDSPSGPEADLQEVKKLLVQFAAPMQVSGHAGKGACALIVGPTAHLPSCGSLVGVS